MTSTPESSAASRRRTRCVYCGTRIPGALTRAEHNTKPRNPERLLAARIACADHRDLPLLDPVYADLFDAGPWGARR